MFSKSSYFCNKPSVFLPSNLQFHKNQFKLLVFSSERSSTGSNDCFVVVLVLGIICTFSTIFVGTKVYLDAKSEKMCKTRLESLSVI
jgi:hypothetical protein